MTKKDIVEEIHSFSSKINVFSLHCELLSYVFIVLVDGRHRLNINNNFFFLDWSCKNARTTNSMQWEYCMNLHAKETHQTNHVSTQSIVFTNKKWNSILIRRWISLSNLISAESVKCHEKKNESSASFCFSVRFGSHSLCFLSSFWNLCAHHHFIIQTIPNLLAERIGKIEQQHEHASEK